MGGRTRKAFRGHCLVVAVGLMPSVWAAAAAAADPDGEPGSEATATEPRFAVSGQLRSRFNYLDNTFRNTTNGFSVIHARWRRRDVPELQAFYTLPVGRLPNGLDPTALRDDRFELDQERVAVRFWGMAVEGWSPIKGYDLDLFVLGLEERDQRLIPSRNRELITLGYALKRRVRGWQINLEAVYQFGDSRADVETTTDLTHRSWSLHSHLRRRFDMRFAPILTLRYDYARGDRVPDDRRNERFDPLYGARRFELGPSGIFGLCERSKLMSPGVSLSIAPLPRTRPLTGYRVAWLAISRDALTTAGLRDPSGRSSDLLGQFFEYRLRWDLFLDRLQLETGGVYLRKSRFFDPVGDATNRDNTVYAYLQATLRS
ncbi:MAG: alginate export family protein [Pseudomonadota bacterium]